MVPLIPVFDEASFVDDTPKQQLNPASSQILTDGLVSPKKILMFVAMIILAAGLFVVSYRAVMVSVVTAGIFAYLLKPLVSKLMVFGLKERTVLFLLMGLVVAFLGAVFILGIPMLYNQAAVIISLVPATTDVITTKWLPYVESYLGSFGFISAEEIHRHISSINILGRMESYFQSGLAGLWQTSTSLLGWTIHLVLIPVLTFFFLKEEDQLKEALRRLIPLDLRTSFDGGVSRLDGALRTAIKGQMIVAGALAILYALGFSMIGLKLGAVIGVIAGICRVIPYFDVIVGVALSTIVLVADFSGGWTQVFMVAAVILVVQGIDGAIITPSVLGDRLGLHPLVVIMSVIAFGDWFGFVGIILAVPTVAVLKVLVEIGLEFYLKSKFYLE